MRQKMNRTDEVLVGHVLKGDQSAFNELIGRWENGLYNFIYRMVGHEEEARDLVQETIIRIYKRIGQLREPGAFPSWIFRIAHNVSRDRLRSRKNKIMVSTEDLMEKGAEHLLDDRIDRFQAEPSPDHATYRKELGEILSNALQTISEEQRTAVIMREYHGYSSKEIAEMLDIPVGTVRSRIFHGLRNLGRVLKRRRAEEEG